MSDKAQKGTGGAKGIEKKQYLPLIAFESQEITLQVTPDSGELCLPSF